ncbi:hypothetical protein EV426DRAFT_704118 [Tirmania nivea]|nr:hypothetical protein EV426DRAFT_704118 [Tirmania nivea]
MRILVPYSHIHEQSSQRPPAPVGSREPAFRNPAPPAAPAALPLPPGSVPRNQQFAEGGEYYTWATRANHQQQCPPNDGLYRPAAAAVPVQIPPDGRPYRPSAAPVSGPNPISRKRIPVQNIVSHHQQQQRQPQPTTNQPPNSSHGHAHNQDRRHHSPNSDNHGTESHSAGDYRPSPRSGHGTPNQSRRGSAICTNGPLQCHNRNCGKRFTTDRGWIEHKGHCRCRNYQTTSGFQCSFVECRGSPTLGASGGGNSNQQAQDSDGPHSRSIVYPSLVELLAHEREHHQVLICVDCQHVFPAAQRDKAEAHQQTCTAQTIGRSYNSHKYPGQEIGLGLQKPTFRGSDVQQSAKFRYSWVKDVNKILSQQDKLERTDFVNLEYTERSAEERGEQPECSIGEEAGDPEGINTPVILPETVRSAIVKQLTGTLQLYNDFLRTASDAVIALTSHEKDEVRKYLTSMANLLQIKLITTGSSTLGVAQADPMSNRGSVPTPAIEISTEVPTTNRPLTYAQTARSGLQPPKVESLEDETEAILNPSNEPKKCQINPQCILSRSNSPSRGACAPLSPPLTCIQPKPESKVGMESPPEQAPPEALELNLPMSALRRVGSNTVVLTTVEGEPLQETHIPREDQQVYFVQMMHCCLDAVYEWFERNREVLLENCECTILNPGDTSHKAHTPEGYFGANPTGAILTKQQKKRLKKQLAAAVADAGGLHNPNQSGTSGDGTPTRPSVCLLHTVTSVRSLNLPRWTHYLRRLVEHGRIPPSIISNRDSFSGEIQPVDEVRHAVNKKKQKTDRGLLALVQQARTFCWQLKDWERCMQLDELYGLLEDKIKLVKDEEGWEMAGSGKGSMRGRKGGRHGRSDSTKVVAKGLSVKGSVIDDTSGDDTEGGKKTSVVKHAFTWPRMLGSDERIE